MKFKVGDRVVGKKNSPYAITGSGWNGVVVGVLSGGDLLIEGYPVHVHASSFTVDPAYFDKVDPYSDRKIIVTAEGKTTTARLYNGKVLEKSAEAKCSPDDRFDFNVGAGLAIDRLLGREAPKPGGFPREELKPGRFGRTTDGAWFVVLEDRVLYMNGGEGWDRIADLDGEGWFAYHLRGQRGVDIVVEAISLKCAKRKAHEGHFIWSRTHA